MHFPRVDRLERFVYIINSPEGQGYLVSMSAAQANYLVGALIPTDPFLACDLVEHQDSVMSCSALVEESEYILERRHGVPCYDVDVCSRLEARAHGEEYDQRGHHQSSTAASPPPSPHPIPTIPFFCRRPTLITWSTRATSSVPIATIRRFIFESATEFRRIVLALFSARKRRSWLCWISVWSDATSSLCPRCPAELGCGAGKRMACTGSSRFQPFACNQTTSGRGYHVDSSSPKGGEASHGGRRGRQNDGVYRTISRPSDASSPAASLVPRFSSTMIGLLGLCESGDRTASAAAVFDSGRPVGLFCLDTKQNIKLAFKQSFWHISLDHEVLDELRQTTNTMLSSPDHIVHREFFAIKLGIVECAWILRENGYSTRAIGFRDG